MSTKWCRTKLAIALALVAGPALSGISLAQEQAVPESQVQADQNSQEQGASVAENADSEQLPADEGVIGDEVLSSDDDADYTSDGSPPPSLNFEVQLSDGRSYAFDNYGRADDYAKKINSNPKWGKATLTPKKGYLVTRHDGQGFVIARYADTRAYINRLNSNPAWRAQLGTAVPKLPANVSTFTTTRVTPTVQAARPNIATPKFTSSMPRHVPSMATTRMPTYRAPVHSMPMRSFSGYRGGMGFH